MSLLLLTTALLALGPTRATDCDFAGGWALRDPSGCPSNTTQCPGGIEPRCCPSDFFCYTTSNAYCCPLDENCLQDVLNVPRVSFLYPTAVLDTMGMTDKLEEVTDAIPI